MIYAGCFGPVTPRRVGTADLRVAVLFVQLLGGAPNALI